MMQRNRLSVTFLNAVEPIHQPIIKDHASYFLVILVIAETFIPREPVSLGPPFFGLEQLSKL